jgi:hypothetical protein
MDFDIVPGLKTYQEERQISGLIDVAVRLA